MAYAFSRVNQALGGDAAQQNQDIFGGASQPQGQVQGQNPAGTTPAGVVKTSSSGAIGAAPQTSEIRTPQEASAGGAGAASKILATNQSTTPDQVKGLGSKLSGASSALQGEANKYVTDATNTNYGASDNDIGDLISGAGSSGATRAGSLLSGAQTPQVAKFAPTTQTSFQEADQLGTDAGIQNMLRRQGGARTTKGELGIESALLRRDPRFQQTRSNLISQNAALGSQRANLLSEGAEGVNARAKAIRDINYKTAQDDIRNKLAVQQADIEKVAVEKARVENLARKAAKAQGFVSDSGFLGELRQAEKDFGRDVSDPAQYASWAGDVSADDFYDQAGADKYSKIGGLLGNPGAVKLAGKGAGKRVNFDVNAYRDAAEAGARDRATWDVPPVVAPPKAIPAAVPEEAAPVSPPSAHRDTGWDNAVRDTAGIRESTGVNPRPISYGGISNALERSRSLSQGATRQAFPPGNPTIAPPQMPVSPDPQEPFRNIKRRLLGR